MDSSFKCDREQAVEMIENMGVRAREEIIDVVRMRKKEGNQTNNCRVSEFI